MSAQGVYRITNLITNAIYIGQSRDLNYREYQYKNLLVKNQIRIFRSIQKYGWNNHKFEVLETYDSVEQNFLDFYEQSYIDLYKNQGYELLNIKDAGSNGRHNESTKKKISASNKIAQKGKILSQEHKNNISKSLIGNKRRLGTICSDETRLKMQAASKGKAKSKIHGINIAKAKMKTIEQYDLTNKLLNTFECADEARRALNVKSAKHIRNCANKIKPTAYGFIWRYAKHEN